MSRGWLAGTERWAVAVFAAVLPLGQAPAEIALVTGLLAWALRAVRERRWGPLLKNPLSGLLLLWFGLAVCSTLNSIDAGESLDGWRKLLKQFGFYLLVFDAVDSPQALRRTLAGCFVGLTLVVGDGLWQAAFGRDLVYGHLSTYTMPSGEPVFRLSAMFDHSASLAIYLVSFCPLALACGLGGERRWRLPLVGLAGLATIALVYSRTRGGIVGFVCALPFLAWWLRHWAPAVVAACAAGLQAATTPPAIKAWAATLPTLLHQLTEPERLMYWQAALNMLKDHPLVGIGTNTFARAYASYRIPGDPYAEVGPYAHNQYLQIAAELGLAGLAVFLAVVGRLFLAVHRRLARTAASFEAVVSAGLGAGLIGYLILGAFESSLFYGRGSLTFWFLAGLLIAVERLRD